MNTLAEANAASGERRISSGSSAAGQLVGISEPMLTLRAFIPKVAARDCNVLVTGETGTGKERVAYAIHANSPRAHRNFVCINCAAIPDSLLESELFGHEKGAFTGAHTNFAGRLSEAAGGTILLDEVGDMSLVSQAKILRAIEQKAIYRVGGRAPQSLDIRIIAATNQDLSRMVAARTFRSDLYYRLNVVGIDLPPLRARREDIMLLFDHCLRELGAGDRQLVLAPEAEALLMRYDWPGNVRELRNVVELLLVDPLHRALGVDDLPARMRHSTSSLVECERDRVLAALRATRWNKTLAARELQCSRMTLYRKLMKYDLVRSEPSPPLERNT